ncbi:MAG: endolytic transglycosylase MltG [Bacteroidia bacterium]
MIRKTAKIILLVALTLVAFIGYDIYRKIFSPNVFSRETYLNIPTGSDYVRVLTILIEKNIVKNKSSFDWLAKKMKYDKNIHPGHYRITPGMNNKDLITLLRSGKQTPVRLTLNNIRLATQLASVISTTLEADSISVINLLKDDAYLKQYGFNSQNCIALFIPNTYEFYWNSSAKKILERMTKEYKLFWNSARKLKAKSAALTQAEVSIIASIVQQETNRDDEKPIIAGVYINRYKKGWKLEADPTLVYALGDFTVQRVLSLYKEIDSPYNTYMYTGLPPGPICIPSISSIEAVLNYSQHQYLYFCARDDFSGYHSFAKTYQEHLINAKRFQKELNRRKIKS